MTDPRMRVHPMPSHILAALVKGVHAFTDPMTSRQKRRIAVIAFLTFDLIAFGAWHYH